MNSMQVKDKLRNIVKEKNVDFNLVLKFYVFDRFIVRLSKSKYKDNFIIKGGFLLSALFGIENRATMDIDSAITNVIFTEYNLVKMVNSIINIDLKDNIKFSITDVGLIREEDEYGGYRIHLSFDFENIHEFLKLDVATGDPITPNAIIYNYKTLLENESINVWSYNIETLLAEKFETVFSRVELSSRMKDYYDIYLIYIKNWENVNHKHFNDALVNTFKKRKFDKNLYETFSIIKDSSIIKRRWEVYSKKYDYANGINYKDIMECLEEIIKVIELISV